LVLQLLLGWYFSTIGRSQFDGGPAVIFLFLFAIACSFAAFLYAEFASMVPVSGSAYTYSYVAFRIDSLGYWLGLDNGICHGNITVAISWSDYFTSLMENIINALNRTYHWHLQVLADWVQMDYLTASNGFKDATALMQGGKSFENLNTGLQTAYNAWTTSPTLFISWLICQLCLSSF
jgi:amino acid transporter